MTNSEQKEIAYSQFLSSFFSSISILGLSVLCLLNNLSFDFYSMVFLLKVVVPATFSFWFIGFIVGKILDSYRSTNKKKKELTEKQAYEIPSMFASASDDISQDSDLFSTGE